MRSHQASRLGPDTLQQVITNVEGFCNTTAETVPLALNDAVNQGRAGKGDLVLIAAVGAGFTAGTALRRWAWQGQILRPQDPHRATRPIPAADRLGLDQSQAFIDIGQFRAATPRLQPFRRRCMMP